LTTYNRAERLSATIDSILKQTWSDFELIVRDDASTDQTRQIVSRYADQDNRIRYEVSTRNLGMPDNLNEGIRGARGYYVANLHDGDLYASTLLEKWTSALDLHPTAAFVFNQYRFIKKDGSTAVIHGEDLPPLFTGKRLLEDIYFSRWRFNSPIWGTVMARRSAYIAAGLFDARFGCVADVDMWMRLAESHDVAYIREPLISIPSRDALPSNWSVPEDVVRKIFWEGRMRHYRQQGARKIAEALRHMLYAGASSVYNASCRGKVIVSKTIPIWRDLDLRRLN
jgi:glycosyltransferase involved in cell wall biosynthesis